jgi:hypothetical protein
MRAYTEIEINDKINTICESIANGKSLSSVLSDENMPCWSTFYKWINENQSHLEKYARACEMRSDIIFDEIIKISDTPIEGVVIETDDNGRTKEKKGDMLGHRKLQIDARKWILSKMNPKKYGDKVEHDLKSSDGTMSPTKIIGITFDPE